MRGEFAINGLGNRDLAGFHGLVASSNRRRRAVLRILQLSGGASWIGLLAALVAWVPVVAAAADCPTPA